MIREIYDPDFDGLVLGCIEAEFCNQILNGMMEALDEIYHIYILLRLCKNPLFGRFAKKQNMFYMIFVAIVADVGELLSDFERCSTQCRMILRFPGNLPIFIQIFGTQRWYVNHLIHISNGLYHAARETWVFMESNTVPQ